MVKITQEQLRLLIEASRAPGVEIEEEARRQVEEGHTSEFYLGFVRGAVGSVIISRSLLVKLQEAVVAEQPPAAELSVTFAAVAEVVELISMRMIRLAGIAAELHLKCLK